MVNLSNKFTNNRKLVSFRDQENINKLNSYRNQDNFLCDNEVYSILKNSSDVTSLGGVAGKPSFQVMHQRLGRPQSATPTLLRSQSVLQVILAEVCSKDKKISFCAYFIFKNLSNR